VKELWGRLRALYESRPPRERQIVAAAGALLVITLVFFGAVRPLLGAATAAARRADAAESEVQAVRALRERYDEVNGRLSAVETRIHGGPKGEIFTTLEDLAKQSAVTVASMEPRTSPASDAYRETKVEVELKSVTLAQVVKYLHEIENAPQLLSIKSLRLRTRRDQPEMLDVTFTVSSFEPL
jgi:general secretion pathway protein M